MSNDNNENTCVHSRPICQYLSEKGSKVTNKPVRLKVFCGYVFFAGTVKYASPGAKVRDVKNNSETVKGIFIHHFLLVNVLAFHISSLALRERK